MISVRIDTSGFDRSIAEVRKQVPYAASVAINRVAVRIRDEEKAAITKAFDRPTKFTQNAVLVKWATKRNPVARIFIRDQAAGGTAPVKYLNPSVYGAPRRNKRLERALMHLGVLPSGMYAMPGQGLRLNQNGNITLRAAKTIIDGLKQRDQGYFAGKVSGTLGVWKRSGKRGGKVKPLLIFTSSRPAYKEQFPFYRIANATAQRHLKREFELAMAAALRTAKASSR